MARQTEAMLEDILEVMKRLEQQAELLKTVLMVKEPSSVAAAEAFEGLRKTIVMGVAERRSRVTQLVQVAVAVSRAATVDDLAQRIDEWLEQADVAKLTEVPEQEDPTHFFEDVAGEGLTGPLEVLEPAYYDRHMSRVLRPGRARRRPEPPASGASTL